MGGSQPDMPMYEEFQDTPWITRNRELNEQVYPYLTDAYKNLGSFDQDYMRSLADDYSGSQWSDLNRQYQQRVNQNLARNYNRLGTTGGSSSGYSDESLNRYYNDLASRVASNTAQYYDQLVGNNLQRQLSQLGAYQNLFNNSGDVTYGHDTTNQQIRWTNQDRAWQNDVRDYNNSGWNKFANIVGGVVQGAGTGLAASGGNPIGAAVGGVLGGIGNSGSQVTAPQIGQTASLGTQTISNLLNRDSSSNNLNLSSNLGSSGGGRFTPSFSGYKPLFR